MIKVIDLTAGQRIIDAAGNTLTVSRVRRIDHDRCRLDTLEGKASILKQDACFHLAE